MKNSVSRTRYTLIEMLCVCAIIIFLVGISAGVYSLANTKMLESKCKAMVAKMCIALENYKSKTGYYPQSDVWAAPDPARGRQWSYFYIDKFTNDPGNGDDPTVHTAWPYTLNNEITFGPKEVARVYLADSGHGNYANLGKVSRGLWIDPWGSKFFYACPGFHNRTSFDLMSLGPDKAVSFSFSTAVDTHGNHMIQFNDPGNTLSTNQFAGTGDEITNWTDKKENTTHDLDN